MAKPDKSADVLLEALSLALLSWSLRQERYAGESNGIPASVTSHCDMLGQFYGKKHDDNSIIILMFIGFLTLIVNLDESTNILYTTNLKTPTPKVIIFVSDICIYTCRYT